MQLTNRNRFFRWLGVVCVALLVITATLTVSYCLSLRLAKSLIGASSNLQLLGVALQYHGRYIAEKGWLPHWHFSYLNDNGETCYLFISLFTREFTDTSPVRRKAPDFLKEALESAHQKYLQEEKPKRAEVFSALTMALDNYKNNNSVTYSDMIKYLGLPDTASSPLSNERWAGYRYNYLSNKNWSVYVCFTNDIIKSMSYGSWKE